MPRGNATSARPRQHLSSVPAMRNVTPEVARSHKCKRQTLPRPPHPAPRIVTIANAPQWGEMTMNIFLFGKMSRRELLSA